jgi:CheY-like chemotaxis protein
VWTHADATRLRQVLGNLLSNALKFTLRGGHVDVLLSADGSKAALSVRDDGVGIAADVLRHLFQPFMQAPQTLERSLGGLGLGLAVVKGLVELHGGTVEAVSRGANQGATLTVRLPQIAAPVAKPQASASAQAQTDHQRVLVIEDNPDMADSVRDLLELGGHEAQVAYDGASGVTTAQSFHPDVVICDLGLPGMNGYDVAKALRQGDGASMFLVALTGYTQAEARQRALEAGFNRHLAKPPTYDDLERVMREAALGRPRAET